MTTTVEIGGDTKSLDQRRDAKVYAMIEDMSREALQSLVEPSLADASHDTLAGRVRQRYERGMLCNTDIIFAWEDDMPEESNRFEIRTVPHAHIVMVEDSENHTPICTVYIRNNDVPEAERIAGIIADALDEEHHEPA